jgi:hypothetical protein
MLHAASLIAIQPSHQCNGEYLIPPFKQFKIGDNLSSMQLSRSRHIPRFHRKLQSNVFSPYTSRRTYKTSTLRRAVCQSAGHSLSTVLFLLDVGGLVLQHNVTLCWGVMFLWAAPMDRAAMRGWLLVLAIRSCLLQRSIVS